MCRIESVLAWEEKLKLCLGVTTMKSKRVNDFFMNFFINLSITVDNISVPSLYNLYISSGVFSEYFNKSIIIPLPGYKKNEILTNVSR